MSQRSLIDKFVSQPVASSDLEQPAAGAPLSPDSIHQSTSVDMKLSSLDTVTSPSLWLRIHLRAHTADVLWLTLLTRRMHHGLVQPG